MLDEMHKSSRCDCYAIMINAINLIPDPFVYLEKHEYFFLKQALSLCFPFSTGMGPTNMYTVMVIPFRLSQLFSMN